MPNVLVNMHKMAMNLQKEKMRNRISVHRAEDLSKLHQEVGTEILPEELGGTNGNIEDLAKSGKVGWRPIRTGFWSRIDTKRRNQNDRESQNSMLIYLEWRDLSENWILTEEQCLSDEFVVEI